MSDGQRVKQLHVELPAGEFDRIRKEADAAHRSLKGEVRRLIREAYRMDSEEQEQPTAAQAGAV